MTLKDLHTGQEAVIKKVRGAGAFRKRLLEMGFTVGRKVKSVKKAPMNDPVEYLILDYYISLRNSEAELIDIALTDGE